MAIALIMDFPGGTREQYEDVVERMQLGGQMAPGGLAHVAGSTGTGWRVMDVWEDQASFERFRDEKIVPTTQAVGLAAPNVRIFEVGALMHGDGGTSAFVQVVELAGIDEAAFEEFDRSILPDGNRPAEVGWHVNGAVDGGWCVIDTWTSREARDRFIQEAIMPAMHASGRTQPPAIEDMDVLAEMRAGAPVA
jgi:quinol monooxygenase YgiN